MIVAQREGLKGPIPPSSLIITVYSIIQFFSEISHPQSNLLLPISLNFQLFLPLPPLSPFSPLPPLLYLSPPSLPRSLFSPLTPFSSLLLSLPSLPFLSPIHLCCMSPFPFVETENQLSSVIHNNLCHVSTYIPHGLIRVTFH